MHVPPARVQAATNGDEPAPVCDGAERALRPVSAEGFAVPAGFVFYDDSTGPGAVAESELAARDVRRHMSTRLSNSRAAP